MPGLPGKRGHNGAHAAPLEWEHELTFLLLALAEHSMNTCISSSTAQQSKPADTRYALTVVGPVNSQQPNRNHMSS